MSSIALSEQVKWLEEKVASLIMMNSELTINNRNLAHTVADLKSSVQMEVHGRTRYYNAWQDALRQVELLKDATNIGAWELRVHELEQKLTELRRVNTAGSQRLQKANETLACIGNFVNSNLEALSNGQTNKP